MPAVQQIINPDRRVVRVHVPIPPMGGKAWLIDRKGIFVLESGPGVLRTIACTHAGAGNIEAIDGLPDDAGFFPAENQQEPHRNQYDTDEKFIEAMKAYCSRNGRAFFRGNPVAMGSWFKDAGFFHGLTIRVAGGHEAASAIATVVWMPYQARPRRADA